MSFSLLIVCDVQETAEAQGVTAMPTFVFYRSRVKIDTLRGADEAALEAKVKKWYQEDEDDGDGDTRVKGHVSYLPFFLYIYFFKNMCKQRESISND